MDENVLISIIVPIYKVEDYLEDCVNSILNQTYTNIEVILVNDGSPDRCPELCDMYAAKDPRVCVIHKPNGGLSSARNAGLDHCKGEYIGFVDSDDRISETMYEEMVALRKGYRTIIKTGLIAKDELGNLIYKDVSSKKTVSQEQMLKNILLNKDGGSVCTRLYPRAVIADKRFDEGKLNEDLLFMVSIIENIDDVVYTDTIGYEYFIRKGSISNIFGKAVHDMVDNSSIVRRFVEDNFPNCFEEAQRFEIRQHIGFLTRCPFRYDRKSDEIYLKALKYVRKNLKTGICNSYLTRKEKLLMIAVSVAPKIVSRYMERKRNKHQ
ncbi:MAG: glycosyltransferase [Clostridia bacterium]|nr:glycosyltransferase [Clostridia bacterium]